MKLYVSNYLSRSISIIDYKALEEDKQIYLEQDIYPHHFCIDRGSNIMYIPSSSDGNLYLMNLDTFQIVDSVSIGGSLNQIVLYDNELFISNEDSNSIYIVDKNKLNPVGVISVENMPHGFDYDIENKKIYVACLNSILCIDIDTKKISNKRTLDYKCWHIKNDISSDNIYISSLDGSIIIMNKKTLNIVKILEKFLIPVEICFSYKNNKVYITDLGYKQIRILDYKTNSIIGKICVNGNPQGMCISKDETRLFVTDTLNNKVMVYDVMTDELVDEIITGKEPTTIVCM